MNPYEKHIENALKLKEFWDIIGVMSAYGVRVKDHQRLIIIEIDDLVHLKKARSIARQVCPDWSDKISQIFNTGVDQAIVVYSNLQSPLLEIWLRTNVETFPKQLLPNEFCKFVKHQEESYRLVCETK
jgi:hypothetical protein